MTLPGEGHDRVFKVTIRWLSQVNLFDLERALEGVSQQIPMEAVQALDVVMRHMPSMTLVLCFLPSVVVYIDFILLSETGCQGICC